MPSASWTLKSSASYEGGFLAVRLAKLPARLSGPQSVKVQ